MNYFKSAKNINIAQIYIVYIILHVYYTQQRKGFSIITRFRSTLWKEDELILKADMNP